MRRPIFNLGGRSLLAHTARARAGRSAPDAGLERAGGLAVRSPGTTSRRPAVTDLRDSLHAFAERICAPLADFQLQALDPLEKPISTVVAPRQSGKSRSLAVLALWWGFRKAGQHILLL